MLFILVTGMPGAGKTLFVERVVEKYGLPVYTMGDVIREDAKKFYGVITPQTMIETSKKVRELYGYTYVAERIVERIRDKDIVVIDGVRSLDEVSVFKKHGEAVIVAIHASPKTRFNRLRKRGREGDPATWEEFEKRDQVELSLGIGNVIALADYMIVNEGSVEEVLREIDNVLMKIMGMRDEDHR